MEDRNSDNHDVSESNNEANRSLNIEEYDVLKTIGKGQQFMPMFTPDSGFILILVLMFLPLPRVFCPRVSLLAQAFCPVFCPEDVVQGGGQGQGDGACQV